MEATPKRRRLSNYLSESKKEKNSDAEDEREKKEGESSPARCPICLAMPENKAKSEACSHYFCYSCLKEWSKVKAECPLCKMPIRTIYYNIKSDQDFEEYHVTKMLSIDSFDNWWHFRMREYRNHMRRHRENHLAAMQASSDIAVIRKRRMYYWQKKKVVQVNTGRRVRDISSDFYRDNPSQTHRLEPWLKRELTVLYGAGKRDLIRRVRDIIMSAVPTVGIESTQFVESIQPYLTDHTEQFVHEFIAFARSPYDIQDYDRHAVYASPAPQPQRRWPLEGPSLTRHVNPLRSRWDDSPEAAGRMPDVESSQSVMLSQTTWTEDLIPLYPPELNSQRYPAHPIVRARALGPSEATPPIESYDYRNPTPPPREFPVSSAFSRLTTSYTSRLLEQYRRRAEMINPGNAPSGYVEAPLINQRIPPQDSTIHHRGSFHHRVARRSSRRPIHPRSEIQRPPRRHWQPSNQPAPEVIVISSDSSDHEGSSSAMLETANRTLHYRPGDNTKQRAIKQEIEAESSSDDSSDTSTDSKSSDIEFVSYIKPPHLRTPDAFIELDSTDDDQPGPSNYGVTKHRKKEPPASSSSSSSFSDEEGNRNERLMDGPPAPPISTIFGGRTKRLVQRTREFLNAAKRSSDNETGAIVTSSDVTRNPIMRSTINKSNTTPQDSSQSFSSNSNEQIGIVMSSDTHVTSQSDMTSQSEIPSPYVDVTSDFNISAPLIASSSNENTSMTSQSTDNATREENNNIPVTSQKATLKKIFERGKVTINFEDGMAKYKKSRQYLHDSSDSDYELDVGVENPIFESQTAKFPEENRQISVGEMMDSEIFTESTNGSQTKVESIQIMHNKSPEVDLISSEISRIRHETPSEQNSRRSSVNSGFSSSTRSYELTKRSPNRTSSSRIPEYDSMSCESVNLQSNVAYLSDGEIFQTNSSTELQIHMNSRDTDSRRTHSLRESREGRKRSHRNTETHKRKKHHEKKRIHEHREHQHHERREHPYHEHRERRNHERSHRRHRRSSKKHKRRSSSVEFISRINNA